MVRERIFFESTDATVAEGSCVVVLRARARASYRNRLRLSVAITVFFFFFFSRRRHDDECRLTTFCRERQAFKQQRPRGTLAFARYKARYNLVKRASRWESPFPNYISRAISDVCLSRDKIPSELAVASVPETQPSKANPI